jgi:hypothetical protein
LLRCSSSGGKFQQTAFLENQIAFRQKLLLAGIVLVSTTRSGDFDGLHQSRKFFTLYVDGLNAKCTSLPTLSQIAKESIIETLSHVENVDKSYMVQSLQRLI